MKKATKILITAAAVAAVAGVSAVSFAAWSAGNAATATATGATGQIVTVGSITATPSGLGDKKLVPYDQTAQWNETTMTKGFSVKVEYTAASGTPTITMKAEGTGATAADKLDITKLEYCATETGTYTAFAADTAVNLTLTDGEATYYFRLNSGTTADMNKGFTITFTAAA